MGGATRAARLGVPIPGAGLGGSCVPGSELAGLPGMVQAPGLDNVGTGPFRAVLLLAS